jgi:hypothetical protein
MAGDKGKGDADSSGFSWWINSDKTTYNFLKNGGRTS